MSSPIHRRIVVLVSLLGGYASCKPVDSPRSLGEASGAASVRECAEAATADTVCLCPEADLGRGESCAVSCDSNDSDLCDNCEEDRDGLIFQGYSESVGTHGMVIRECHYKPEENPQRADYDSYFDWRDACEQSSDVNVDCFVASLLDDTLLEQLSSDDDACACVARGDEGRTPGGPCQNNGQCASLPDTEMVCAPFPTVREVAPGECIGWSCACLDRGQRCEECRGDSARNEQEAGENTCGEGMHCVEGLCRYAEEDASFACRVDPGTFQIIGDCSGSTGPLPALREAPLKRCGTEPGLCIATHNIETATPSAEAGAIAEPAYGVTYDLADVSQLDFGAGTSVSVYTVGGVQYIFHMSEYFGMRVDGESCALFTGVPEFEEYLLTVSPSRVSVAPIDG